MRGDKYGSYYAPHTQAHLDKFAGGPNGAMQAFLYPYARQLAYYDMDDFGGDALNLDMWAVSADVSATTWAVLSTGLAGGVLRGSTGAVDDSMLGIYGHPNLTGDNNGWMEVRFKIDDVSVNRVIVETGLVNAITDATAPVITDIDTPASGNGGTDLAVFHIDGSQTTKVSYLVTDGSTSNMNCTKTALGYSLTNATYTTVRVGLAGDSAYIVVDNNPLYAKSHGALIGSRVEGGSQLRPWFLVGAREAGDVVCDIDYFAWGCDRSTR